MKKTVKHIVEVELTRQQLIELVRDQIQRTMVDYDASTKCSIAFDSSQDGELRGMRLTFTTEKSQ